MENLWPKLQKVDLSTPKAILAQQVAHFNSLDTGLQALLTSETSSLSSAAPYSKEGFSHTLRIKAIGLGGFTLSILRVEHDVLDVYPAWVFDLVTYRALSTPNPTGDKADNEAELISRIKSIIQSKAVVNALQSLISQSA